MNDNFDDEMQYLQDVIDDTKRALKVLAGIAAVVAIFVVVTS